MYDAITEQTEAFVQGFHDVLPLDLLRVRRQEWEYKEIQRNQNVNNATTAKQREQSKGQGKKGLLVFLFFSSVACSDSQLSLANPQSVSLTQPFKPLELENLICGFAWVDMEDLLKNTIIDIQVCLIRFLYSTFPLSSSLTSFLSFSFSLPV